jgi:hypothetical protein
LIPGLFSHFFAARSQTTFGSGAPRKSLEILDFAGASDTHAFLTYTRNRDTLVQAELEELEKALRRAKPVGKMVKSG